MRSHVAVRAGVDVKFRAHTIPVGSGRLTRIERAALVEYPEDAERPATRGECAGGPRPCPFVSCEHHLYLDVSAAGGIKLNFPDLAPEELTESCALDVADRGGLPLEAVGAVLRITRERIRQIEEAACRKLAPLVGDAR